VVLDNRAVETITSVSPPALGKTGGQEVVAGRPWLWTRQVSRTADPDILRVDIAVASPRLRQPSAMATVFRTAR